MNEQKDQETVQALCPTWRKMMLDIHETGRKAVNVLMSPMTWIMEHFDGTVEWKAREARLDAKEKKTQELLAEAV